MIDIKFKTQTNKNTHVKIIKYFNIHMGLIEVIFYYTLKKEIPILVSTIKTDYISHLHCQKPSIYQACITS